MLKIDATALEAFIEQKVRAAVAEALGERPDQDPWLDSSAAAAAHLGVSRQRIHDLVYSGALPRVGEKGERLFFRRSTLDAYREGRSPIRGESLSGGTRVRRVLSVRACAGGLWDRGLPVGGVPLLPSRTAHALHAMHALRSVHGGDLDAEPRRRSRATLSRVVLNIIVFLIAIGLAIAPFYVLVETAGWVIGQHSFPDGSTWGIAGLGVIFWIFLAVKLLDPDRPVVSPHPRRKRYVMRGYGGGKNATSLHPRQAKRGMRIVYIPGVGYRHVKATKGRQT